MLILVGDSTARLHNRVVVMHKLGLSNRQFAATFLTRLQNAGIKCFELLITFFNKKAMSNSEQKVRKQPSPWLERVTSTLDCDDLSFVQELICQYTK